MDCGGTGGRVPFPQHRLQKGESKFRRAVTFFKYFGRKTSVKGKIAWPTSSGEAREIADTSRHAPGDEKYLMLKHRHAEIDADAEVFELASRASNYPTPWPELPSHTSYAVHGNSPPHDYKHPFEATSPFEMYTRLSHTVQHEMSQPEYSRGLPGDLPHSMGSEPVDIRSKSQKAVAILPLCEAPSFAPQSSKVESALVESKISSFKETYPESLESIESVISRLTPPEEDHHFFMPGDLLLNSTCSDYTVAEKSHMRSSMRSSMELDSLPSTGYRANANVNARPAKARPIYWLPKDRHQLREAIVTSAHRMDWEPSASIAREQPSGNLPTPYLGRGSVFSSDDDLVSLENLIQELREHVSILNKEWLERLASCPDLLILCSTSSARILFELGINALKNCYSGTLVSTFIDVFALMHVACASAYMLHRDDESYCWDGLLQDMLGWQHAILEETESLLFVRVMDKLSTPQGALMVPSDDDHSSTGHSRSNLLEILKTGQVVKDCAILLDGNISQSPYLVTGD